MYRSRRLNSRRSAFQSGMGQRLIAPRWKRGREPPLLGCAGDLPSEWGGGGYPSAAAGDIVPAPSVRRAFRLASMTRPHEGGQFVVYWPFVHARPLIMPIS